MFMSPISSILGNIQQIGKNSTPRRTSSGGGGGVFGGVAGAIPPIMANEPDGSVLSQYYRGQQQGRRIPGYEGNVSDMRTTAPDGRPAYVDDYGNMYYLDTGAPVKTREIPEDVLSPRFGPNSVYSNKYQQDVYPPDYVYPQPQETTNYGTGTVIPEDLNQPMVGPNSAYGPYYDFGPYGPYDTRNINDPRHPDNPNNRPQVAPYDMQTSSEVLPTQTTSLGTSYRHNADGTLTEIGYDGQPISGYTPEQLTIHNEVTGVTPAQYQYVWNGQGYDKVPLGPNQPQRPLPTPPINVDEMPIDLSKPYPLLPPQPDQPTYPTTNPDPLPEPKQSAGYLRSTGEGGYGAQAYYDEINAYLANHNLDEISQAMNTYGVSQEDVNNARNMKQPQDADAAKQQLQYARGGLSRMLRKVR